MTDSFEQISAHNEGWRAILSSALSAQGVTVSTAESLTAGMISSTIADISGASAVLRGGAVTYRDAIEHRVLVLSGRRSTAIPRCRIRPRARWRRVSLELYQSDVAVSATGYAGPGGGTEDDRRAPSILAGRIARLMGKRRSWTPCAATMGATVRVFVPMRSRRHWGALPLCSTLWNRRVLKGPPGLNWEIGTLTNSAFCWS